MLRGRRTLPDTSESGAEVESNGGLCVHDGSRNPSSRVLKTNSPYRQSATRRATPATRATRTWFAVLALLLLPAAAHALEFHVNTATGDNDRTPLHAQSPSLPWKTIQHALNQVPASGGPHTIHVAAGTYTEAVESAAPDIILKGSAGTILAPPSGKPGLYIEHTDFTFEDFRIEGGTHGVRANAAHRLKLRGLIIQNAQANGIHIHHSDDVLIENSEVRDPGSRGIFVVGGGSAYVRNNLVVGAGEWGVEIDGDDRDTFPPSEGHLVAFNTIVDNGTLQTHGGLRFENARGEIRDNILADNENKGAKVDSTGTLIHHNLFWNQITPIDDEAQAPPDTWANVEADPLFADAVDWLVGSASPAIDMGSAAPAAVDISGSVRDDGTADDGLADAGRHAGAGLSTTRPAPFEPEEPPVIPEEPGAYFVDCANGDDNRSAEQASEIATPWQTIRHAVLESDGESVITVLDGTCTLTDAIEVDRAERTIRTATPLGTTLIGAAGRNVFNIESDHTVIDGFLIRTTFRAIHASPPEGVTWLEGLIVRGVSIAPPEGSGIAIDAVTIKNSDGALVENNRITGAVGRGIQLRLSRNATIRNNLLTGGTGNAFAIDLENDPAGDDPPLSTGNLVAFNTVDANRRGIRLNNAAGEVRDNLITNNATSGLRISEEGAASLVHHNNSFANGATGTNNWSLPSGFGLWASNSSVDPLYVDAVGGDLRLSAVAAGQAADSPLLDAGSAPIGIADIDGSTRSDGVADDGRADPGFHEAASALGLGIEPIPAPDTTLLHVDCAGGDDSLSRWEVSRPWDGWSSIATALDAALDGETIVVRDGACAESLEIETAGITLRAENDRQAAIEAPSGTLAVRVEADRVALEGLVIRSDREGVLVSPEDSDLSLHQVRLYNLLVEPLAGADALSTNGIRLKNTFDSIVDSCEVHDATKTGIAVLVGEINDQAGGGRSYVRNNLVTGSGEWGIHVDSEWPAPTTAGHVLSFNTLHGNGTGPGQGGLRLQNATGEVRENIVHASSGFGVKTDTAPVLLHHNLVFANGTAYDTEGEAEPTYWNNLARAPGFVDAAGGDFRLSRTAAGDATDSSAIDAGSGTPAEADISGIAGHGDTADSGTADLGFHRGAAATFAIPALSAPPPGLTYTRYVDVTNGDDTASPIEVTDPERPWQSLSRALRSTGARSGDIVLVRAGTYVGTAETSIDGVTIVAEPGAVIDGDGGTGFFVENADTTIDGFVVRNALHGVRGQNAARLRIQRNTIETVTSTGIKLTNAPDSVIDSNEIIESGQRAIHVSDSPNLYVRNNRIRAAGTWAVHLDTADEAPTVDGALLAFNTIEGAAFGGIRFENVIGTIRDNILSTIGTTAIKTDTAPADIHHNNLFAVPRLFDERSDQLPRRWSNSTLDPHFVDAESGDLRLSSTAAGDATDSPLFDRGSSDVSDPAADISGTTTRDGVADDGRADPGYHAEAAPSAGLPASAPARIDEPGSGGTFYVDPGGDNLNSSGQATLPGSPWRTLSYAVGQLASGDTLMVRAGDYSEAFTVPSDGIRIVGDGPLGAARLLPPDETVGIGITGHSDIVIENLLIEGGSQAIRAEVSDGLRVRGVAAIHPTAVGIQVRDSSNIWIDSSIVTGAADEGLLLLRSDALYLRNNLVYANGGWGISVDNDPGADPPPPVATGNLIEFNTVHANGDGMRMLGASGEVRNNILTNHLDLGLYLAGPDIYAHHNVFAFNGRDRDRETEYEDSIFFWSYIGRSPKYVDPDGVDDQLGGVHWADDSFALGRESTGQSVDSPVIDRGSDLADVLGIDGSTSTAETPDTGTADPGFHAGASFAIAKPPPSSFDPEDLSVTYFVSAEIGEDGPLDNRRTEATARDPSTPWATILYAVSRAEPGDTIVVLPGMYRNSIQIDRDDITIRADIAGTVVVEPVTPTEHAPETNGESPPGSTGFTIEGAGVTLDGIEIRGGTTGISALETATDLSLLNCVVRDSDGDGIRVQDAADIRIENCVATTNAQSGIKLRNVQRATVRNNLVYGNPEWGITLDNSGTDEDNPPPLSVDNLVASNTVAFNGSGNLRLDNTDGIVRDNLLTNTDGMGLKLENAPATLHHNGFFAAATPIAPADALFCDGCEGNLWADPRFLLPNGADGVLGSTGFADDDFRLAQIGAGQTEQSLMVDAGSGATVSYLIVGTTAADGAADTGTLDLGYHYENGTRTRAAPEWNGASAQILHVGPSGSDTHTREQAADEATPWRTIEHAVASTLPGDTLVLAAGTWTEPIQIRTADLTLLGAGALGDTVLQPGDRRDAIRVRATGVEIRNLTIDGARRGITLYRDAADARLADLDIANTRSDGIALRGSVGTTIDRVAISACRRAGLYASRASGLEVRNIRISACRRAGVMLSRSSGTIEFATIHEAGRAGVRIRHGAGLTLRDSILTGHRVGVHARSRDGEEPVIEYLLLGMNSVDLSPADLPTGSGMQLGTDPLYVDPDGPDDILGGAGRADDLLFLTPDSPAMDSGSGTAADLGVASSSVLAQGGAPDTGVADLGAHR